MRYYHRHAELHLVRPDGDRIGCGAINGTADAVTKAAVDSASSAVQIAIGLVGIMTLWLGIMRVAEAAGLVSLVGRALRPLMRWLFPEVPAGHPAGGALVLALAANMLGLNNAATPLGIKAMEELQTMNPDKDTATQRDGDVHGGDHVRRAADPGDDDWRPRGGGCDQPDGDHCADDRARRSLAPSPPSSRRGCFSLSIRSGSSPSTERAVMIRAALDAISLWAMPVLLVAIPFVGLIRKVKVYDVFIEGAKEGFDVGVKIIPFLVGILVAIGMFRGVGGDGSADGGLRPLVTVTGFPAELVPLAILRSLTGSGSLAFTTDLIKTYGPDSVIGRMAATLYGSSETTFYVLAVYFGAVGVRRTRHAVPAALVGDIVAAIAAVVVCAWMFSAAAGSSLLASGLSDR